MQPKLQVQDYTFLFDYFTIFAYGYIFASTSNPRSACHHRSRH